MRDCVGMFFLMLGEGVDTGLVCGEIIVVGGFVVVGEPKLSAMMLQIIEGFYSFLFVGTGVGLRIKNCQEDCCNPVR